MLKQRSWDLITLDFWLPSNYKWYTVCMQPKLIIEQKITPFANQYRIFSVDPSGGKGDLVAYAQQKRMAFKEKVRFYSDEQKQHEIFGFRAEKVLDVHGKYFVEDTEGNVIGSFQKAFKKSLFNSTWNIPDENAPTVTISETNKALAVVRRVLGILPVIGDFADIIMIFFLIHFTFADSKTGEIIGHYRKTKRLRDHYELSMTDEVYSSQDWRVWAAMAVGLDALQSR